VGFLDKFKGKKKKPKPEVPIKSNKILDETTITSSNIKKQRKMYENAYAPWSKSEDERLRKKWSEYSKNNTNESEIKMQLTKDFGRSKKAISRRLQRLGLLEIKNKHITEPKPTLDEIRTSAKENNERLYFCLNEHVRKSGNYPVSMSCHCGLTSNYVERSLQEFENHPVVKKNKGGSTNVWYNEGSSGGGGENSGREGKSSPDKITEFIINLDNSQVGKYSNVILSWKKPKENDSKIEKYKIQFKNNKEKSWQELNSEKSEIEIQLTKGSKYQFRIASENKHGTSEYSASKEKFVTSSILDKYQQQAVSFSTENPLLITAGPGSGKTTVVAERVKDLILNQNIDPEKILCVTFTKAGQQEMIKRFQNDKDLKNVEKIYPSKNIRTYHSLSYEYLRLNYGQVFDLKRDANENENTSEYTDEGKEWKNKFKKDLTKFEFKKLDQNDETFEQLIYGVSAFKREKLGSNDLKNYLEQKSNIRDDPYLEKLRDLYKYFKKYQEFLLSKNQKDYDDLLFETVLKLKDKDNPVFRTNKRENIDYVIIDEFQDNNFLQFEIIKELTSSKNITAVGDQNQSIYSFQGASIELFKDFKTHYSNYGLISLKNNYRSTPQIVNASNNFLERTSEESNVKAITINPDGPPIHIREFNKKKTEYDYFIKLITSNVNQVIQRNHTEGNKRVNFSDFTILVRTNNERRSLKDYLVHQGIPCRTKGWTKIQYKDNRITNFIINFMGKNELKKESLVSELIKKLDTDHTEMILKKIQLNFEEEKRSTEDNDIHEIIFCIANTFKNNLGDTPISKFNSYINNPTHPKWNYINAVEIRTVHSVKGEEFPYVIISNSNEKHFPLNFRERELKVPKELQQYKSNELEQVGFTKEESRLFYVAMTRAKFELFITYSLKDKDSKSLEQSRFIDLLKIKMESDGLDYKEKMGFDDESSIIEKNKEIGEGEIEPQPEEELEPQPEEELEPQPEEELEPQPEEELEPQPEEELEATARGGIRSHT
jgi:DNA helicase-2/ATP-dependent DNA helicase PcrA